MPIRWHEDDPDLLDAAIHLTAGETGFPGRLIEKDYLCSVLVHTGFHRLSEDLDFSISATRAEGRASRSRAVEPLRRVMAEIATALPLLRVVEPLTGSNRSTQYNAVLGYVSRVRGDAEVIKVEVGLREPAITAPEHGLARTVLISPLTRRDLVAPFPVRSLSYREAMAEKLRAALCRREAAIRDFFDVDHAVERTAFDTLAPDVLDLVRVKVAVPGTGAADVSPDRLAQLRRQLVPELRPVVHPREFERFDLDRAFNTVRAVAGALG